MKYIITLLLSFLSFSSFSQTNYDTSASVSIPLEGWNKLLLMKNGNTMLFHFEPRKGIVVKVFDKSHKEIASEKHICKILDINALDRSEIKGIFEVNNEAVLFIEQAVDNRQSLIRLRIDATNASLIEEKIIVQSTSLGNITQCYVLKDQNSDNYSIFCYRDVKRHPSSKIELLQYNEKNEMVRDIPLNINIDGFEYLTLEDVNIATDGTACITLCLANLKANRASYLTSIYSRRLVFAYLPKSRDRFLTVASDIPDDIIPYYTNFTVDSAHRHLNLLLEASSQETLFQDGNMNLLRFLNPYLFIFDSTNLNIRASMLVNNKINDYIRHFNVPYSSFAGIPVKMFTNAVGLTTVIYEEYARNTNINIQSSSRVTDLGAIGITQYDDTGGESWGIALPKTQIINGLLSPTEISDRGVSKYLFRRNPTLNFQDQFASITCYNNNDRYYIFYNDFAKNYNNTIDSPGAYVSDYDYKKAFFYTDAFYYKMDQDRVVKKYYLFSTNSGDESKSNLLESADYDQESGTYVTLMLHRRGKEFTTNVAWCHLE
ncbi:MAG TPA: hypothetical protein VN721_02305 [Flavipsychrobacter sp.]|nr:hypothetical protein [Flavipsychrobacter sp.]